MAIFGASGPVALILLAMTTQVAAEEKAADRPAYRSARSDEDWSALRDPVKRTQPLDPIKWIPLTPDGGWFATVGGEVRERIEASRNPVFGLAVPARNEYLLHRVFLFADVHYGSNVRTFVEFASGLAPGYVGVAPPTQKNELDLLQGFSDLSFSVGEGEVLLRAGRQELSFGSSRLVSVRESPNFRRSFDGVRASWVASPDARVDAFAVRPVAPQPGLFNDASDPNQSFWGVYATGGVPGVPVVKADVYYLGIDRKAAIFAQSAATELRETIGGRLFGKRDGFDWNSEIAFQFGSFGVSNIRAWTASTDVGYTFSTLPMSPRFGLKADAISGDGNLKDNTLGTFNPLFPKLPYFSEANLVAPMNLLDIQPNLSLSMTPTIGVTVAWNPLWKQQTADAVYSAALLPIKDTAGGVGRYVGQQTSATVSWAVDASLTVGGTYVHYVPGQRLKQVGGASGDFVAAWVQWLF